MLCFRDMTFCSAGDHCGNRHAYGRWLNKGQKQAAKQWWASSKGEPPIAFADFRKTCPKWIEDQP